ncbi:hypothetical protein [Massilia psychrophila]|uniref:hypothetical protein n=1 Tax=Massilia psychrophila TaxID=1603353 RepID=UPI0015D494B2|nr:hypothetical protein [Massilia psychrophila]
MLRGQILMPAVTMGPSFFPFFSRFWSFGTQRIAGQRKAMVALHDAIQNDVGNGSVLKVRRMPHSLTP